MADSLAAIKKLVFEERKITPEELWNAILDDYTSEESQRIQEMLINDAPKYGNDIDEVDQLVVDVYNIYIDEMKNIQILVMEEVQSVGFVMLVLQVFLPTLDKAMAQWLLQMEEKHIHLLLRDVHQLMRWIKRTNCCV